MNRDPPASIDALLEEHSDLFGRIARYGDKEHRAYVLTLVANAEQPTDAADVVCREIRQAAQEAGAR